MNAPQPLEPTVPLVVDVDGTLIRTDLLHEGTLQFLAQHPLEAWRLPVWLARGKANLKTRLADLIQHNPELIPLREETMDLIRAAQAEGRQVWLASASDKRWVEPLAGRLGSIAGVIATGPGVNLAGRAKAAALVERFGERGFDYVGDGPVDMHVWASARRQYVIDRNRRFVARVTRRFPEAEVIGKQRASMRAMWKAMRPHQWAKNLLIFLPVVAGHTFDPQILLQTLLAFVAFCFAASSAYIVNDLLDLPGDREHPRKRHRPFAACEVGARLGLVISATLGILALGIALLLPLRFGLILLGYVFFTLAYSIYLKRRLLIDVIVLGGLYTIRVFAGVAASEQTTSQWLLMFSLFLFLSLAIVKRCAELVSLQAQGLMAPAGRGYRASDLPVLFGLGAAAGFGSILVIALYLSSPEVRALYSHWLRIWLVCPLLLYWIGRMLLLASRNQMHDDPLVFAIRDRVSWMTGLLTAAIVAAAV